MIQGFNDLPLRSIKSQKKATVWPQGAKVIFLINLGLFTWGGAQLKRKKLNFLKSDFRVTVHKHYFLYLQIGTDSYKNMPKLLTKIFHNADAVNFCSILKTACIEFFFPSMLISIGFLGQEVMVSAINVRKKMADSEHTRVSKLLFY